MLGYIGTNKYVSNTVVLLLSLLCILDLAIANIYCCTTSVLLVASVW